MYKSFILLLLTVLCFSHVGMADALRDYQQKVLEASGKLDQVEVQMVDINTQLKQVEAKIKHLKSQSIATDKQLQNLNQEVLQRKQRLGHILRLMQRMQFDSKLKVALHPQTFSQKLRLKKYYAEIRQQHINTIQVMQQFVKQIRNVERTKQSELATLKQKRQQLASTRIDLRKLTIKHKSEKAEFKRLLQLEEAKQFAAKKAEEAFNQSVKRSAAKAINRYTELGTLNFSQLKGKLAWPSAGEFKKISDGSYKNAWQTSHKRERGVRAIAAGTVSFLDQIHGIGYSIMIRHGNGYQSVYSHLGAVNVKVNQRVQHGQLIATSGVTGGRDEIGLFFQLRYRGQAIDSSQWFVNNLLAGNG